MIQMINIVHFKYALQNKDKLKDDYIYIIRHHDSKFSPGIARYRNGEFYDLCIDKTNKNLFYDYTGSAIGDLDQVDYFSLNIYIENLYPRMEITLYKQLSKEGFYMSFDNEDIIYYNTYYRKVFVIDWEGLKEIQLKDIKFPLFMLT